MMLRRQLDGLVDRLDAVGRLGDAEARERQSISAYISRASMKVVDDEHERTSSAACRLVSHLCKP